MRHSTQIITVIARALGSSDAATLSNHTPTGRLMTELLNPALQAHGGLDRWNKAKAIQVAASISGAIWYVKSKGDFLKNVALTAETRNERVTVDFPGQDKRSIFRAEPHCDRNRGRNPNRGPR